MSAIPAATMTARSRHSAPVAVTTRSAPLSCRPAFELSIAPHRVAKLSGIGCSSKAPTYFLGNSHGFNTVHGRMPSVLTGANLANRDLIYMGVSGDGDSASIGLGQFAHLMRRGVNMSLYRHEQWRVRPDQRPVLRDGRQGLRREEGRGQPRQPASIWRRSPSSWAQPSWRARSPATKPQLVPLIKAAISHPGAAILDVVSPCVAFNNHAGSTKSYDFVRDHNEAAEPPRLSFYRQRRLMTRCL